MLEWSHIQFKVKDINKAILDFKKLGFSVTKASNTSPNALIWFEEGPFIELLGMKPIMKAAGVFMFLKYGRSMLGKWNKWTSRTEGILDFAVEPKDKKIAQIKNFPQIKQYIDSLDIESSEVITWSRKPVYGEKVYYSYITLYPSGLPFVVSDYSYPQRPEHIVHPNGANRLAYLRVAVGPKEYDKFLKLVKEDKRIIIEKDTYTHILSVGIEGISKRLNAKLLHNVKFESR